MTAVLPDTDRLTELDWDHEPPCEHSQHANDRDKHDDGPAKWLQIETVQFCRCPLSTTYVCDKWAQHVLGGLRLRCSKCHTAFPKDAHVTFRFVPLEP